MLTFIPFLWGFAEATAFFIAPDVWLTALICLRKSCRGLQGAIAWAVSGAIVGGFLMYLFGQSEPGFASQFLDRIPGINLALIGDVRQQIQSHGIFSSVIGGIKGIPFKIYATQWGIQGGDIFLLVGAALIARGLRFIMSAVIAEFICRLLSTCFTERRVALFIWLVFWLSFYWVYFGYLRKS